MNALLKTARVALNCLELEYLGVVEFRAEVLHVSSHGLRFIRGFGEGRLLTPLANFLGVPLTAYQWCA